MCLLYCKSHRVPFRIRSLTTFSGKPCTPWLKFRPIHGIRRGTHLKNHCIASGILKLLQLRHYIFLRFGSRLTLPLRLPYDVEPRTTEFPFRIIGSRRQSCHQRHPCQETDYSPLHYHSVNTTTKLRKNFYLSLLLRIEKLIINLHNEWRGRMECLTICHPTL